MTAHFAAAVVIAYSAGFALWLGGELTLHTATVAFVTVAGQALIVSHLLIAWLCAQWLPRAGTAAANGVLALVLVPLPLYVAVALMGGFGWAQLALAQLGLITLLGVAVGIGRWLTDRIPETAGRRLMTTALQVGPAALLWSQQGAWLAMVGL